MKQRRNQSEDGAAIKQLQQGYTLYNQQGQKFYIPKGASDVDIEQHLIMESNYLQGDQIRLNAKRQNNSQNKTVGVSTATLQQQKNYPKKPLTSQDQRNQPKKSSLTSTTLLSQAPTYRIAHPYSNTMDVNAKLWQQTNRNNKALKKLPPKHPDFENGGKTLKFDVPEIEVSEIPKKDRPQTVTTNSRGDIQSIIKAKQKLERPMTTNKIRVGQMGQAYRIKSANINIRDVKEEKEEDGNFEKLPQELPPQQSQQTQQSRPMSAWTNMRPISAKTAMPEQFFQQYTKYTNFSALDLPYEELFDRNERTIGATFARFGDLGYYSPIQRIGAYMQFSAKLKADHLKEIVDLMQTMSTSEKEEPTIPIQLGVINELKLNQKREKTGINAGTEDAMFKREPVTLSLFPEYFDEDDEGNGVQEQSQFYFAQMMEEMGGNYEPSKLGKSRYIYIDQEQWPEQIRKQVDASITRYNHYVYSEQIRANEIPKYKKNWMVNAFSLINEKLLKNEECSRQVFQEIFETFKISMKRAMIDYILRSPEERKRLHITLIPREYMTSAQRISREGGFNILLFPEWHSYVERGQEFCNQNLTLISKRVSYLLDWFHEFRDFKLTEFDILRQVSLLGYTFSLTEFTRIQTIYKLNVICLFQHIWHRGALAIIKKGKIMRDGGRGKWTFIGPITDKEQQELNQEQEDLRYIPIEKVLQFIEQRLKLNSSATQFKDSCAALAAYLEYYIQQQNPYAKDPRELQLENIGSDEYHKEFKQLEKEERKKVLDNASVLMKLQMRKVIEQSLDYLNQQILSIRFSELKIERKIQHHNILHEVQDFEYKQQKFLDDQRPILQIDMTIEGDQLKFKESEDVIKSEFMEYFRGLVSAFDKFTHPRYCKLVEEDYETNLNNQKKLMRQMQFNFDSDMGGLSKEDFEQFYKSFWFNIKLNEKQPKEHPDLLLASVGVEEKKEQKETKKYITVASMQEQEFVSQENKLISHILKHYDECVVTFSIFDQFQNFIDRTVEKEIKNLKKIENDEFRNYMSIFTKYNTMLDQVPQSIDMPLFQVNCQPVIRQLQGMIKDYKDKIFSKYESELIDQARAITDRYIQISNYIRRSLKTPDDVEAMEKYISDLVMERVTLKSKTNEVFSKLLFVFKQNFTVTDNLLSLCEELYNRPDQLDKELEEQKDKHNIEKERLEETLIQKRNMFKNRVEIYTDDIHNFETFTEKQKYKNYIQEIEEFEETLVNAQKEMNEIIDQEVKLFQYSSNFDSFYQLSSKIEPFSKLWKAIGIFMEAKKRWLMNPINQLDASEVETILKSQKKVTQRLNKEFLPNSIPLRVCTEFQLDIDDMNTHLPAIELLSNPGLNQRHWTQIEKIMGIKFNYKEGTLRELLNKNVKEYLDRIEDISENASKEFSLENGLRKMEQEWQDLKLVVINYKDRGILILQGAAIEDIQIVLDEHVIKAQTIRTNPSVKFMEDKAIRWEKLMLYLQEVLDLWIKLQSMYIYLEPIFSFDDISRTLFEESEKFQKVTMNWQMIMSKVEADPIVKNLNKIPDLLEILKLSLKWIDEIQKGLENHLEIKRLEFPRFFFLSNDDLINILAESRDPLLVQPHMRKCFEGIDELIFSSQSDILGIKSVEKEEIIFVNKVSPKDYKGSVEKWLLKVEDEMRNSLQHIISDSYVELVQYLQAHKPRQDWLKRWPAQAVFTASQLYFTAQVEQTIQNRASFDQLSNQMNELLKEIVNLVRTTNNQIERMMLSALIVLEVHNNDVIKDLTFVKSVSDFKWLAQLRYYIPQEQVMVHMVYTRLKYMYEYMGVGTRLVITPLTDRCYRTLVGALQQNLGGAPEGPAGTGKTESTKDLAKAIGVQCVVFNCGEGLNAHAMGKFFKGLATSGAWSCFDEFNRIELEVLSVIAQQILHIQQAKSQRKGRFMFEGTEIQIQQSCNIFITMNPGYAGRSDLPDNLKALFRPCAMMVPDYALIAEISLYSYGFVEARVLAKKIVAVYKLCSEQLSSQDHYDYGMRAVKAVLTAASSLKKKSQEKEELLILRAICDINLPKFLQQDVTLFNGIIQDLFPQMKAPVVEYKALNDEMTEVISKMKLQQLPSFRKKVLQLYEMIYCRHGLMLVGQTLSGKSRCYQVLAQTLGAEEKVAQYHIINPKSLTLSQLYGYSDPISKEWTEGVLGEIYRKCANSATPERQFIVFDGPVDAGWIENMNTVLDDNKKLCLMSGETIAMSDKMTIMFEVQDLMQASPATVSRCGMVYLSTDGWRHIFQSLFNEWKNNLDQAFGERIEDLFEGIIDKCIHYVKSKCNQYEKVPEISYVISLLKFLRGIIEEKKPNDIIRLDAYFIYSVIWTIGGSVDENGRKQFDGYFKKMIRNPQKGVQEKVIKIDKQSLIPEMSGMTIYDFYYDQESTRWIPFKDCLGNKEIDSNIQFNQIMVETSESYRIRQMLRQSVENKYAFLMIGPSGVGKTVYIRNYLQQLEFKKYLTIFIQLSVTTQSVKTQQQIDQKLDRRRKGIYGPPLGMEGIIHIDDLNMPQRDKYNSEGSQELIRQYLDQGGWYGGDRQFMKLINLNIICSMSPRQSICSRLLRHFNIISVIQPDNQNLFRIYNSIMSWHINKFNNIQQETVEQYNNIIEGTIDLYNQIKDQIKPTPSKSWYIVNMRDISRCVQGLVQSDVLQDRKQINRLWLHEVSRTFYDRLCSDYDQIWIMIQNSLRLKIRDDIKQFMKPYEDESQIKLNLSNSQFLTQFNYSDMLGDELTPQDRKYTEIHEYKRLQKKLEFYLDEMNSVSKKPIQLALFDYALNHILRINRILRMQQGHGLLIGLGGSGRQSLCRLVTYIREIEIVKIEQQKQQKEELQKLLIAAGVDNKENCLYISDQHQYLLEDVNSLLNTGDIPNLFQTEDFLPLIDKIRTWAKKQGYLELIEHGTNLQYYEYFIKNAKNKLHILLGFSPIGQQLRNNIRMYPSIVNCVTINYFHQWPDEALESVSKKYLQQINNLDNHTIKQLTNQFKVMHQNILQYSQMYLQQEQRFNYVTPSNYFELLNTFIQLNQIEKSKLEDLKNIYTNGVSKLDQTQQDVQTMESELKEKQPLLIQMNEDTQVIAENIQSQAEAMEPKKEQAIIQEQMVNQRVQEAQIIKDDCEKDLSVAKPKLKKAEDALNTIDSNDINSIKAMLKPPETVQLVMEAVCVLCGVPPIPIPNPKNPKERIQSYWEASKKFIVEKDFIQKLINYDKDNIKPEIMQRIRDKYISNTSVFNVKRVEKASSAAKGLCEWILALDDYEKVLKVVRPKQQKYNESKQEVEKLQKELQQTRDELQELNDAIEKLKQQYEETNNKLQQLNKDIQDCEKKLERAQQLMNQLGGERERWLTSSEKYKQKMKYIIGDLQICSGIIGYLGVFENTYRTKIIKLWMENIQHSDHFTLEQTLCNQMLIRRWKMNGLPNDQFSIDNAIIMNRSLRYSLLIDPQGQGNKYVKMNEMSDDNRQIKVTKLTDSDFYRNLENSISFGQSLIIENVSETLDNILDPILLKQTFKHAGILSVKLGENIIEYSKHFRLFITTKLPNPHYQPEISTKITLINFTITQLGLEDQLLELCVQKEKPDLEEQKNKLIIQSHHNLLELQRVEDQILQILNNADNILDDEKAIQVLQQSKAVANDIEEKQKVSSFTASKIHEARIQYKPIAIYASMLFFSIIALQPINPIYSYSLSSYIALYQDAFDKAEQSSYIKQRISNVNETLIQMVYNTITRALFEKDKLLFSFIITIKQLELNKHLDHSELSFLINPIQLEPSENPFSEWLPHQVWLKSQQIAKLSKKFSSISDSFATYEKQWKDILKDPDNKFPEPFSSITPMQKLCLLKVIRPDRILKSISDFVSQDLGPKFINPPSFSLTASYSQSLCTIPLMFVLPGTDPMTQLIAFAESKNVQLRSVSLGQGQGIIAQKEIEDAKQQGYWVILQNCHLAASWMPKLEKIVEDLVRTKVHPTFRLWLSSYSTDALPPLIIQSSIKMTNEPPSGIKSNMIVSYQSSQVASLQFNQQTKQMLSLLYSLCFFHAILQERRSYGPLGFNICYDFNQSDLQISVRQLQQLVQKSEGNMIDFGSLHYLVGECNYGGRVTDERDRRILKALLREYMSEAVLSEQFRFGGVKDFFVPQVHAYDDFIKAIDSMSTLQPSYLFGLHPNSEIVKDQQQSEELLSKLQVGKSEANVDVKQIAADLLAKFPKKFDTEIVLAKYPLEYKNSINTVFLQEVERYNRLIIIMQASLKDIDAALKGMIAMSTEIEASVQSMTKGLVPDQWLKVSYPSLKPLASYIQDFLSRISHFQKWLDQGAPKVHWISGFFFTQSFLTAVLQNYARKYTIAIDQLLFAFDFFEKPEQDMSNYSRNIQDGSLIYGLFIEGGRWDYGKDMIVEQEAHQLFSQSPIIWLKPIRNEFREEEDELSMYTYKCPVYKTGERRGILSTTGHSTNFIMNINVPSAMEASHWVKRGVAMLCQLSE